MNKDKIEKLRQQNIRKRNILYQKAKAKQEKKKQFLNLKNEKMSKFSEKIHKYKLSKLKNKKTLFEKKYTNTDQHLKRKIQESQAKHISKLSFFNKWLIHFSKSQIKKLVKKFKNKKQKINFNLQIEKINKKKAENQLEKLNIDEALKTSVLEKRIQKFQNSTKLYSLKNKIKQNKEILDNKIKNIEISNREKFVPNYFKSISVNWNLFKVNNYVLGTSLSEVLKKITNHLRKYSMYYILGFILIIFAITTNLKNINPENIVSVFKSNTYILIIGLGMLLVIVGGYIDLSVGALLGFIGALSVQIYNQFSGNIFLTLIFTVAFGIGFGLFQGFLIGYLKMPAFIVTLGGMLLFQGLLLTITESMTLVPIGGQNSSYVQFVKASMPDITIGSFHLFSFLIIFSGGIISAFLLFFGRQTKYKYGIALDSPIAFLIKEFFIISLFSIFAYIVANSGKGLEYYIIYIILLVVLFIFLTQNTTFGRKVFAMGGNKKAAALSGINTKIITVYIFAIIGALTAFAAIVFTGIVTSATPSAGSGYELDVIASVFVGGASMQGGIGTVPGTIIGGLILGFINNGMQLMNYAADLQKITKALVLLAAVGYDVYSNRKIG